TTGRSTAGSARSRRAPCAARWAFAGARSSSALHQRREIFGRMGLDAELHAVMPDPAIFGALPPIDSGRVRLETDDVGVAGHGIDLAAQPGNPQGMDHVDRLNDDIDRLAG